MKPRNLVPEHWTEEDERIFNEWCGDAECDCCEIPDLERLFPKKDKESEDK